MAAERDVLAEAIAAATVFVYSDTGAQGREPSASAGVPYLTPDHVGRILAALAARGWRLVPEPLSLEALDVERLARAMASVEYQVDPSQEDIRKARRYAAEYAALSPDRLAEALIEAGYTVSKSAPDREDDLDFAALLHDNGFQWDDANAVNAILSHHRLAVVSTTPPAEPAP